MRRGDILGGKIVKEKQTTTTTVPPRGTKVRVHLGPYVMDGVVLEDRGNIGVGGRRLVRIGVALDTNLAAEYELPLEKIELLAS